MAWIFYVLSPVLIHLVFSEGITILAGDILDSAACTALSAFLVLPVAIWMYWQDAGRTVWESDGVLRHKSSGDAQRADGNKKDRRDAVCGMPRVGWYTVCFLGGGILNVIWSRLLFLLGVSSAFSNQTQEALLGSRMAMQVLGPGFLVPIAEELVFRGLVYRRMRSRLRVRQAAFFSALLFALYHGNPIQMIYAFPMALFLALLCERENSLIGPILFHMGANLAAILFS
ncbi:MAG: CPBP family intramembrane metalloprotease [Lachnospiraceae bacterium]|nr:CPBP family intramembrane metalloprotease [Lachnospiraceae bacterium]